MAIKIFLSTPPGTTFPPKRKTSLPSLSISLKKTSFSKSSLRTRNKLLSFVRDQTSTMVIYFCHLRLTFDFKSFRRNYSMPQLNRIQFKNKEGQMNLEIITKDDLAAFKGELLTEIRQLMQPGQGQSKKWIKSNDVRKLLNISPGTLQNLRINGTLSFTRIGSIIYYKLEDINKLLEGGLQ